MVLQPTYAYQLPSSGQNYTVAEEYLYQAVYITHPHVVEFIGRGS